MKSRPIPIEPNCLAVVLAFNPEEVIGREVKVKTRAAPGLYRNGGNKQDIPYWRVPENEPYWIIDILDGRLGIIHERYLMRIDGGDEEDDLEAIARFDPDRVVVTVNGVPL